MRRVAHLRLLLLVALWIWLSILSCTHRTHFPDNGRPTITTAEEFAQLSSLEQSPEPRGVRIAGRLVRAEKTAQGWKILADWLPYPTGPYEAPVGPQPSERLQFYLLLPGPMDDDGRQPGNEFLLTGRVTGKEDLTTLLGRRRAVPLLEAECLHVWKTAGADLQDFLGMDPLDQRYPPPLRETYCATSQL